MEVRSESCHRYGNTTTPSLVCVFCGKNPMKCTERTESIGGDAGKIGGREASEGRRSSPNPFLHREKKKRVVECSSVVVVCCCIGLFLSSSSALFTLHPKSGVRFPFFILLSPFGRFHLYGCGFSGLSSFAGCVFLVPHSGNADLADLAPEEGEGNRPPPFPLYPSFR